MKRKEGELENGLFDPLHFVDPLTEWLWQPQFTDARSLLAYHATCRFLWRDYSERSLELLVLQWKRKFEYHSQHNLSGIHYQQRHQLCVLDMMIDVTRFNDRLCRKLVGRNKALAEGDKQRIVNPFSRCVILFQLGDETDLFHFMVNSYLSTLTSRGCFTLRISTVWLKQRFGWDLLIFHKVAEGEYYPAPSAKEIRKEYWVGIGNSKYE